MDNTPRVIIVRHGPTEWSENGRHTGRTDIPLTAVGEELVLNEAKSRVGPGLTVDTSRIARVYTSPRIRAKRTMELFLGDFLKQLPAEDVIEDERLTEWNYGDYEGLTPREIRASRPDGKFFIWRDGCPNGEQPEDIEARLDSIIADIHSFHAECITNPKQRQDVVVFAHGHSLRVFVHRWLRQSVSNYMPLVLPTCGVGTLSYEHNNVDEPAVLLGR